MANSEHLKILKRGVKAWNKWKAANTGVYPDDESVVPDLSGADLRGMNLGGANLTNTNLRGVNLNGTNLMYVYLRYADLSYADLSYISPQSIYESGLTNISGDLFMANLEGANLQMTSIIDANINQANLQNANLSLATIAHTSFRGANLTGTDFTYARFSWVILGDNDLSSTKGLENITHQGPTTIGVDTIYRSQGKIPDRFLRGAGVPDNFITYARSLTNEPIDFYSCFISYSSKDQNFTERLYTDLQNKGVRCWYAPEDLKIGEKIRVGIDESISVHDKLLLILSKNSIESEWVEKEVEAAMERERQQKRMILFPIRLDDAVLKVESGWAADVRRSRNIGDFRRWKSHDAYSKAFESLLRDLQSGET